MKNATTNGFYVRVWQKQEPTAVCYVDTQLAKNIPTTLGYVVRMLCTRATLS